MVCKVLGPRIRQGLVCVFLLMFAPQASGGLLFDMEGGFWDPEPVEAHGTLLIPPEAFRGVAHAQFLEGTMPRDPGILETGQTKVTVKKWVEFPFPGEPVTVPQPTLPEAASWASLEVAQVHEDATPQVIAHVINKGSSTEAVFQGASCEITPDYYTQPAPFLDGSDDNSGGYVAASDNAPDQKVLVAECAAEVLSVQHPRWIDFYGMDLLLDSSEHEEPETIRTGTWTETDETGLLTRKVTQVLQMRPEEPPRFVMDWDADLKVQAPALDVIGSLGSDHREGWLTWGDHDWQGPLDAWRATGHFTLDATRDEEMALSGTTTDAPPRSDGEGGWASTPIAAVPVVLAAGGVAGLTRSAWGLFARIPAKKVLEHPRRAAIMAHVRADPGAEVTAVARELEIARGVALHHIKRLRQEGFIRVTRLNGRTALFAADSGHLGNEEAAVLLRRDASRNLYEAIRAQPGIDQSTLADMLDITQQRVSLLLKRMDEAGLVRKDRKAGRLTYYPARRRRREAAALPNVQQHAAQEQTSG